MTSDCWCPPCIDRLQGYTALADDDESKWPAQPDHIVDMYVEPRQILFQQTPTEETDVELMIAAREQYRGLGDSTVEHRPTGDTVVVTDGGIATESSPQDTDIEAQITGPWTEPAEQGGATYYRYEDCGRESLRCGDGERSEFHAEECVLR